MEARAWRGILWAGFAWWRWVQASLHGVWALSPRLFTCGVCAGAVGAAETGDGGDEAHALPEGAAQVAKAEGDEYGGGDGAQGSVGLGRPGPVCGVGRGWGVVAPGSGRVWAHGVGQCSCVRRGVSGEDIQSHVPLHPTTADYTAADAQGTGAATEEGKGEGGACLGGRERERLGGCCVHEVWGVQPERCVLCGACCHHSWQ